MTNMKGMRENSK